MDPTTISRQMAKLEYAAMRMPFAVLEGCVIARYCDEDDILRLGFERFLGSMDWFAGLLLADETISGRGLRLLRRNGFAVTAGPPGPNGGTAEQAQDGGDASERRAADLHLVTPVAAEPPAWETVTEADGTEAGAGAAAAGAAEAEGARERFAPAELAAMEAPAEATVTDGVAEAAAVAAEAGERPVAAEAAVAEAAAEAGAAEPAEEAAAAKGAAEAGAAGLEEAGAAGVEVEFSLPAEVRADSVALCGDFNGWSAGATMLGRGRDGSWRVTVSLQPGRSYRFRYLLDGERWVNAWHADRYVPNSYGSSDSVVVVD